MKTFLLSGFAYLAFALLVPSSALTDELKIVIHGVKGAMLENVRSRVEPFRISGNARLSRSSLDSMRQNSVSRARSALRPFGYYHAEVAARVESNGEGTWTLDLTIERGPPVLITKVVLDVQGDGAGLSELQQWKAAWPLRQGEILNQPLWDEQKQKALGIAEDHGYLLAEFIEHKIAIDLENNAAELELMLETGAQAVMGNVTFHQDVVNPGIVEALPRFLPGDPYSSWIQERFRLDIWHTGYFGRTEVLEDRLLEESPPRVDLTVNLEPRKLNTYQGAVGVGSDTGPRLQLTWNRHLVSRRGDRFMLGMGWQQHNNEAFLRGNYRIPRKSRPDQFWTAEGLAKRETEDLKVRASDVGDDFVTLATADINDYSLKLGRLKIRDRKSGFERLFETIYMQLVRERSNYRSNPVDPEAVWTPFEEGSPPDYLERNHTSLAIGMEWSLPVIRGNGWGMVGHNHRAWVFTANEAWGSDSDFSQAYGSTRWSSMWGKKWKLLLRGEAGYSDARVKELDIFVEGQNIHLSVTDLPNLYRFKAGGSSSVRGYGFERLSNNGIGSNNVITASAELEMLFRPNWSVAAFVDVGNAFNDWDKIELKKGVGVGIRWYTIAGAIRVDFAKALDLEDQPWRIHFTIGTSLL